jgi:hypothetical protein
VTLSCELRNGLVNLRFAYRSQVPDLLAAWCVSLPGEGVIDGPAHTFDNVVVHALIETSVSRWSVEPIAPLSP